MKIKYEETMYGFNYGAAEVTRIHSDPKKLSVVMMVKTPKHSLQIHVTKTGKVRVWDGHKEMKVNGF